jgi:hypothetical protein
VQPPLNVRNSEGSAKRDDAREDIAPMNPPSIGGIPLAEPVQAAWIKLLREGRSWSPEKTHEYVEAARKLQEVLDEFS